MRPVSVVIPTYNRKDYVQEAIDSVLGQTVPPCEIVVVDDGSTDGTWDALRQRYGDRIAYIWQANQGESVARNRGIEMAKGDYVAFLDSDDLWLPEKLERQLEFMESGCFGMVYCSAVQIDACGRQLELAPIPTNVGPEDLLFESLCMRDAISAGPSSVLISRALCVQLGGFASSIRYGEDWEFWLRVSLAHTIGFLDEPLLQYRRHVGAQWGGRPSPDKIDGRLATEREVLERLCGGCDNHAEDGLRDRALARAYYRAAMMDYLVSRPRVGQERLTKATSLDPGMFPDDLAFSRQLVNEVYGNVAVTSDPFACAAPILSAAWSFWPSGVPKPPQGLSWLKAEFCETLFFDKDNEHGLVTRLICLLRASPSRPRLLTNRGVYSILAHGAATWIMSIVRPAC